MKDNWKGEDLISAKPKTPKEGKALSLSAAAQITAMKRRKGGYSPAQMLRGQKT